MIDTEIFDLLYTHLKERTVNSVRDHLNSDADYQEVLLFPDDAISRCKVTATKIGDILMPSKGRRISPMLCFIWIFGRVFSPYTPWCVPL